MTLLMKVQTTDKQTTAMLKNKIRQTEYNEVLLSVED